MLGRVGIEVINPPHENCLVLIALILQRRSGTGIVIDAKMAFFTNGNSRISGGRFSLRRRLSAGVIEPKR